MREALEKLTKEIIDLVLKYKDIDPKEITYEINPEKETIFIEFDENTEVFIDLTDYANSYTANMNEELTEKIFFIAFNEKHEII